MFCLLDKAYIALNACFEKQILIIYVLVSQHFHQSYLVLRVSKQFFLYYLVKMA